MLGRVPGGREGERQTYGRVPGGREGEESLVGRAPDVLYYAASRDGDASWEANLRVTAASFTPVLPSEGGAVDFIGD